MVVELPLFACREAYVYRIPPATTAGHRAELWDVNTWLQEVALRAVSAGDECYVRLEDQQSGKGGPSTAPQALASRAALCSTLHTPLPGVRPAPRQASCLPRHPSWPTSRC